jgi:uncharacterized protein YaaW (UPF0174 family)
MENNTLQHHGILGMKWGVRRFQNRDGSLTSAGKKRRADDSDTDENKQVQDPLSKKAIKKMSDAEIQDKIDRLELEKKYKSLMNEVYPPPSHEGKKFVKKVLEKSGENITTQLATYAMGTVVNKALADLTGDKSVVNPKKGQKDK